MTTNFVTPGIYGATGSTGWTTILPSDGTGASTYSTNIIYVSDSLGTDATGGTAGTLAHPLRTISYAMDSTKSVGSLGASGGFGLRNGYPDWVLIKMGDTFTDQALEDPNGAFDHKGPQGTGSLGTEPMVFGSYDPAFLDGTSAYAIIDPAGSSLARPLIKPSAGQYGISLIGAAGSAGNNCAFIGLDLYAYTRDPAGGGSFDATRASASGLFSDGSSPYTWMLVEDCKFRFFLTNICFNAPWAATVSDSITIRRSTLANALQTAADAHAMGFQGTLGTNAIFEENTLDYNGWYGDGSTYAPDFGSRNFYYAAFADVATYPPGAPIASCKGNIFSRSGAQGAQFRSGGIVQDNLFLANPQGFDFGHQVGDSESFLVTSGTVTNNVILEGAGTTVIPLTSISNATPAVFTKNSHGLSAGMTIRLTTTGAIPSGLAIGTLYFIIAGGLTANQFEVSGTLGGTAVNTSSAGSGTHSYAANPVPLDCSGIDILQVNGAGIQFSNNIMAHITDSAPNYNVAAIDSACINVTFSSNIIYDCAGVSTYIVDHASDIISGNDVASSGPHIGTYPYPDATKTIGSYAGTIGLTATLVGFMAAALGQCKQNWGTALHAHAVNTYIQQGFGLNLTVTHGGRNWLRMQ